MENKSLPCSVLIMIVLSHLYSSVSPTQIRCLNHDRSLLLQLKHDISINTRNWDNFLLDVLPPPKVWSWNDTRNHRDCCLWEGVTCDSQSGHVVGLDLSSSSIVGGINGSSSLFRLRRLQHLSLAHNHLYDFPRGFSKLSSLTHLNLSWAGFQGPIPEYEISTLGRLVSLDLSHNNIIGGASVDMEKLVTNLTRLRVLRLDGLYLSYGGFSNKSLSSLLPETIRELRLADCNLTTVQFASLLHMRSLTHLVLSRNNLTWNVSDDYSFVEFPRLIHLDLSDCALYGTFPGSVFLMRNLQHLDVSSNPLLAGALPEFPTGTSPVLQAIHLSHTIFSGEVPVSINNLVSLKILELDRCNFTGFVPSSIENLTELHALTLSGNYFNGPLPLLTSSKKIELLDLSYNNFSGNIPQSYGDFDNLLVLDLAYNDLQGHIPISFQQLKRLETLDISSNKLSGNIPIQLTNLKSLLYLDLSYNSLSGAIPVIGNQLVDNFGASCYTGNPELCGPPLPDACFQVTVPDSGGQSEQSVFDWDCFGYGIACGWGSGVIFGILVVKLIYGNPFHL